MRLRRLSHGDSSFTRGSPIISTMTFSACGTDSMPWSRSHRAFVGHDFPGITHQHSDLHMYTTGLFAPYQANCMFARAFPRMYEIWSSQPAFQRLICAVRSTVGSEIRAHLFT